MQKHIFGSSSYDQYSYVTSREYSERTVEVLASWIAACECPISFPIQPQFGKEKFHLLDDEVYCT